MNENQRIRVSVPISGIDTSTPDALVADGKCERLHNLRFDGSSWWNVLEGPKEIAYFNSGYPLKMVYQHPANKESFYIAVSTEPNYACCKNEATNEIIYLEPQEDSDIAKVYRKRGEQFIVASDIVVNFDHQSKMYYNRVEEVVDNLGVFEEYDNPLGDGFITLGSTPKVGNSIYKYNRDSFLITEFALITEVSSTPDCYQLRVRRYEDLEDIDLDVVFVEFGSASIPTKKAVSVIPPYAVVSVDIADRDIENVQVLCVYDPSQSFSIHHFGKVLFVRRPDLLTFILKDDKYEFTDFSRIRFQCSAKELGSAIDDSFVANGVGLPVGLRDDDSYLRGDCVYYPLATRSRDQFLFKQFEADEWRGEICYFLAARMEDGTVIAVSPLFLKGNNPYKSMPVVVQKFNGEKVYCLYKSLKLTNGLNWPNSNGNPTNSQISTNYIFGSNNPVVEFTVYTDNDNSLISDIALYSTRILPTFELGKLPPIDDSTWDSADSAAISRASEIFTDTAKALTKEPFYLVDSISWDDYKNGRRSFHLKYSTLEKAVGNPIYEPNANITPIVNFLAVKEYNNCMHFSGPTRELPQGFVHRNEMIQNAGIPYKSTSELLYGGLTPDAPDDDRDYEGDYEPDYDYGDVPDYDDGGYEDFSMYAMRSTTKSVKPLKDIITRVVKSNKKYYVVAQNINQNENQWTLPTILSYPDANANSIMFCTGITAGETGVEYKLAPINAINYAFHIVASDYSKFSADHSPDSIEERTTILKDIVPNRFFPEHHKLFVSATNNSFMLPFDQVYGIGTQSNKIISINSAAIEMSDAKFGEMPLYAFTNEGIFALQSGAGTVLYSNIIPINYDRIINPRTLAINYNLIYITEEGVKSISSNQTTLLSKVINDAEDKPLLNYLRDAELLDFNPYGELIIHKPESDYAFVLALKGGYWATRDFRGTSIGSDKLYVCEDYGDNKSHLIFDLSQREEGETRAATLKTRPMKLGSHEFKRLETFIPRLCALGGVQLTIRFYGSNDRVNWAIMREVNTEANTDITLRRFPFSARYIYVEIEIDPVDVNAGFDISSFDIEYYNRFLNRLR